MPKHPPRIAAIEGGGSTFKVAVCTLHDDDDSRSSSILHRFETPSDDPVACLVNVSLFLQQHGPYVAAGIATFGPVGCRPGQTHYGRILPSTPKAQWRGVDVLTPLRTAVGGVPILMDTDVNAPAVAEYAAMVLDHRQRHHHHRPRDQTEHSTGTTPTRPTSCAYITVGTGVGVGLVVHGQPVHGRMHPEGGHIPVHPLPNDPFPGYSWGPHVPFGGVHTVEGLTSSVALTERWLAMTHKDGMTTTTTTTSSDRTVLADLPDECEIWEHSVNALSQLCASLLLTLSVEKIVLGGGLLRRTMLLDRIRARTKEHLNGYLDMHGGSGGNDDDDDDDDRDFVQTITLSQYGDDAGLQGAIALARRAAEPTPDEAERSVKQSAFAMGLGHGMLVGAVGTALVVKYGLLSFGRGKK